MQKSALFFALSAILLESSAQAVLLHYEEQKDPYYIGDEERKGPHYIREAHTTLSCGSSFSRYNEPSIILYGVHSANRPNGLKGYLFPGALDSFLLSPAENKKIKDYFAQYNEPLVMRLSAQYKSRPRGAPDSSWPQWESQGHLNCDAFTIFPHTPAHSFNESLRDIKITMGHYGECDITIPQEGTRRLQSEPLVWGDARSISAWEKEGREEMKELLQIQKNTKGPIGWGIKGVVVAQEDKPATK